MGNFLYLIALILIVLWAIGLLAYNAGAVIHILLALDVIAVLLRIIKGN